MPVTKDGITFTEAESQAAGAEGIYTNPSGSTYLYRDGVMYDWSNYNPEAGTASATTASTAMGEFSASDFAEQTNLPDWASSFVNSTTSKQAAPAWEAYQKSRVNMKTVPQTNEEGRKASELQYGVDLNKSLQTSARTAATNMAASGTAMSSVGTDYIASLANEAVQTAMGQQAVNVTNAENNYQNLVDSAAAATAFTDLIGEYLSNTQEKYSPGLGDLNLDPGTTDYSSGENGTDPRTTAQSLDMMDFAGQSGLEDWAEGTTQSIVEEYGDTGFQLAADAAGRLQNADMDQAGNTLNKQYGGLSDTTMSLLNSALGSAGLSGGASPYSATNTNVISDAATGGKQAIDSQTTQWVSGQKQKQSTDALNANAALSSSIGAYLGLAKYSYDPNLDAYLDLVSGTSQTPYTGISVDPSQVSGEVSGEQPVYPAQQY
jgi:hypothetical protein